ncbi:MAG: hypothetical protein U1A78_26585 [Polyangia bacterium]
MRTDTVLQARIASRKSAKKKAVTVALSRAQLSVYKRALYYAIYGQTQGFPLRPAAIRDLIANVPDALIVGSCFASVETLALGGRQWDKPLARRTVQLALRRLEELGLLVPYWATTIGVRHYLVLRERCPTGAWLALREAWRDYETARAERQPGTRTLGLPELDPTEPAAPRPMEGDQNARGGDPRSPDLDLPLVVFSSSSEAEDPTQTHTDPVCEPVADGLSASAGGVGASFLTQFSDPEDCAFLDAVAAARRGEYPPPSRRDSDGAASVYYVK